MIVSVMPSTNEVLSEAHVVTKPLSEPMLRAILRTMLTMTEHAVLITDLEHRSLGCNSHFGDLFGVDPKQVPYMEVEELRKFVYPRLQDPDAWVQQLEKIYARPELTHSDELELVGETLTYIQRRTGPLADSDGTIVGRLWSFEDVTDHHHRQRRRDAMYRVSTFHDPDPTKVCKFIVEQVTDVYGSPSMLSLRTGDRLVFREVAGVPETHKHYRENTMPESYCQEVIEKVDPLVVQDASVHPRFHTILPARMGFTRYLGVPICDMMGAPIGTLCLLDGKSKIELGPEDVEFMSVLANRLTTELERERLFEERLSHQRAALEVQRRALTSTQEVLSAMNRSFEVLVKPTEDEDILRHQAVLLRGMLGYDSAAVLLRQGDELSGFVANAAHPHATPLTLDDSDDAEPATTPVRFEAGPGGALSRALGSSRITVARLPGGVRVALGSEDSAGPEDELHWLLLTSLVEQVSLTVTAFRLQRQLSKAHQELRDALQRLIQTEKLSVVGTLAASIAHDIRNIMASLSIECSAPTDDPARTLANVRTHLDRFSVLSHRLLAYCRPRFLAREEVDINEIVDRAANMLRSQIDVSGVKLQMNLESGLPRLSADGYRLEHLMVNLMLNALQAMRSTGGILELCTEQGPDGVWISVRDNGRGIPAEVQARLFEPFVSSRSDGFGLGLYSCQQIAEEHGWKLDLMSEVGRGTTFRLIAKDAKGVSH
jgi:signal transduction histidine kinase